MKHIYKFLILLLACTRLFAFGTAGKITGFITDAENNAPIAGAEITVDKIGVRTVSNDDGQFYLLSVPVNMHTLTINHPQYHTVILEDVKIVMDNTIELNVELERKSELQNQQISEYTNENIVSLSENVRQIEPGMQALNGFEDQGIEEMHMRGGRRGEVSYLLDGLPIPSPFFGQGFQHNDLNNSAIEQIHIKEGAFDAEYGGDMANMVSIITHSGQDKFAGNVKIQMSNPARIFSPDMYFNDKKAIADIGLKPDYLRDYRDITAGISGFVPFTNKTLTFSLSGNKTKTAYRAYEFDDLTYNVNEDKDSENNLHLNRLDSISDWRAMGFIDSWNIYSKLNWKPIPAISVSLSLWSYHTAFKMINTYDYWFQFYERGLSLAESKYDREALNIRHKVVDWFVYDIKLAYARLNSQLGATKDGTSDSRFLELEEYQAPILDDNYSENPYWFEFYVGGHEGVTTNVYQHIWMVSLRQMLSWGIIMNLS